MVNDWWGYDLNRRSWVYLDRTLKNNKPEYKHLPLVFICCDDMTIFEIERKYWNEPRFFFESQAIKKLPQEIIEELARFKTHRFKFKNHLSHSLGLKKERKKTDNLEPASHFENKKLTPEQIRNIFRNELSDDEWTEIISYAALMKEQCIRDQGKINDYISINNLWDRFPKIRSMNDHGYTNEIRGITPLAYKVVCKLMNLVTPLGNPLLRSRKY